MLDPSHSAALQQDVSGLLAVWMAVAAAPLLVAASRRSTPAARVLAAAIPAAVLAIVALHLLPTSLATAGLGAAAALLAGFAAPTLTDLLAQRGARSRSSLSSLVIVLLALTPHFLLDGLALIGHEHGDHHGHGGHSAHGARVAAIVLHTLPLSAMLWLTALRVGRKAAGVGALLYTALATAFGFVAGDLVLAQLEAGYTALFDAFVAGTLVHVASHAHGIEGRERLRGLGAPELVGIAGAVALTFALSHAEGHSHGGGAHDVWATVVAMGAVVGLAGVNLWLVTRRACPDVSAERSA